MAGSDARLVPSAEARRLIARLVHDVYVTGEPRGGKADAAERALLAYVAGLEAEVARLRETPEPLPPDGVDDDEWYPPDTLRIGPVTTKLTSSTIGGSGQRYGYSVELRPLQIRTLVKTHHA